jgi:EmrB/QacA subfamily drug resistance transporter
MFIATLFLVIMDGAITTVALPAIAQQFHVPVTGIDSVVVVYPVCVGMVIPVSGWLGDRFGCKPVLLTAMALFTASSMLCGLAGSLGALVLFRALQGLTGGLLTPVAGTMLFRTFTPAERVSASRVMILPQQVAPAVAPMLGGFLVDHLDWRWVFYVNLPFGLLAVAFGLLFLANEPQPAPGRFDVTGFVLSATAMSLVMYALSDGASRGWSDPLIVGCLAAGAVLAVLLGVVQLRSAEPMLRFRLFRLRSFRDSGVLSMFGLLPFMSAMYVTPLYLQEARGVSAFQSGSATFPEAFGVLLTVQLVAVLRDRVSFRTMITCGLTLVAAVLGVMSGCDAHTGLWTVRVWMFLLGLGMGAVFMPVTVSGFSEVGKSEMGQASTLSSVVRQLSMALGPAVVATLLAARTPGGTHHAQPPVAAYRTVYEVLAATALASAVFALTIRAHRSGGRGADRDGSGGGTPRAVRLPRPRLPLPSTRRPADQRG